MNKEMNVNALVDFINNIQLDVGWWYIVPSLTNEQKEKRFFDLFPSINEIFGINAIAMGIFLKEIGWYFQHGKNIRIDKRCIEDTREQVINRAHFEASLTQIDGVRNVLFIKIGEVNGNPVSILKQHRLNPRRFHPSRNLCDREVMKATFNSIVTIIKNSPLYNAMLELYISNNNILSTSKDVNTS